MIINYVGVPNYFKLTILLYNLLRNVNVYSSFKHF